MDHFQGQVMLFLDMLHLRCHLEIASKSTAFEDIKFRRESTINYQSLGSKRNLDERWSRESVKNRKRWKRSVRLATFKYSAIVLLRDIFYLVL